MYHFGPESARDVQQTLKRPTKPWKYFRQAIHVQTLETQKLSHFLQATPGPFRHLFFEVWQMPNYDRNNLVSF
jgi:hypothetical protein